MAENTLNSVSAIPPVGQRVTYDLGPDAAGERTPPAPRPAAEPRPAQPAEARPAETPRPEAKPAAPTTVFQNVRLHFKIDPDTHALTVLMVDSNSHRVIRSIPPEELQKLAEGDLVELLA